MLSNEVWADLAAQGQERTYSRGEQMLSESDKRHHVLVVKAGLAKVFRRHEDGSITWLAFRGPKELLGEQAVSFNVPRSADVEAVLPCTATLLDADSFNRFVTRAGLESYLWRLTAMRQRESDEHRTESTLPTEVRLARTILRLLKISSLNGIALPGGLCKLPQLSQEVLAEPVGVCRQSVSRVLAKWRDRGVISTGYRTIIIPEISVLRGYAYPLSPCLPRVAEQVPRKSR
ncbi:Crp/Fnr family transcriptional regulator [Streptomyces sp. NPDC004031]